MRFHVAVSPALSRCRAREQTGVSFCKSVLLLKRSIFKGKMLNCFSNKHAEIIFILFQDIIPYKAAPPKKNGPMGPSIALRGVSDTKKYAGLCRRSFRNI